MTLTINEILTALEPVLGKPKFTAMSITYWDHEAGSAAISERDNGEFHLSLMPVCRQNCCICCMCGINFWVVEEGPSDRAKVTRLSTIHKDVSEALATLLANHIKTLGEIRIRLRKLNEFGTWATRQIEEDVHPMIVRDKIGSRGKVPLAAIVSDRNEDADFIVNAPADIETLLWEIEKLKREKSIP